MQIWLKGGACAFIKSAYVPFLTGISVVNTTEDVQMAIDHKLWTSPP